MYEHEVMPHNHESIFSGADENPQKMSAGARL